MKLPNFLKRINISKKVASGYVILLVINLFVGLGVLTVLRDSLNIDRAVTNAYTPVLFILKGVEHSSKDMVRLSKSWVETPNAEDKQDLERIVTHDMDSLLTGLKRFLTSEDVEDTHLDSLHRFLEIYNEVLSSEKKLMEQLRSPKDYEDPETLSRARGILTNEIVKPMEEVHATLLKSDTRILKQVVKLIEEKYVSFDSLENFGIIATLLSALITVIVAYFIIRSIVNPIRRINVILQKMGLGEIPEISVKQSSDEIGDMVVSLNYLRDSLQATSGFASAIGRGNLGTQYQLRSEGDVLGRSLLSMRDNLKKVLEQTNEVVSRAGNHGDLAARIELDDKEGVWKELCISLNNLLDSIAIPFNELNRIANAMAEGDLSVRVNVEVRGDIALLASNLNKALGTLTDLINQISRHAFEVGESSAEMLIVSEEMTINTREIASSISEMSSGAQNQVVKVDESSGLVEGILRTSHEMGDQADNINQAAQDGVANSEKGFQLIEKVSSSMNDIATFSANTYNSIQILTTRSNEIARVLSVISDIASQTNLLALNAAIEAAQAGDAGRGFAVVAEEIRKLAEDSKVSAKEIETLISSVQEDVSKAAQDIDRMKNSVKSGEEATGSASAAFKEITGSSTKTLEMSQEIRKRVQEQIQGIKSVVSITESVVVIAEQTAAGTEEIASSATELSAGMDNYVKKSKSLSGIAAELSSWVSKFRLKS